MNFSTLEQCGIPWQLNPDEKWVKSYLKRIHRAQLKLPRNQEKLIGLDFVPVIRSKHLSIEANRRLQIAEILRQKRLLAAIVWINKKVKLKQTLNSKSLFKIHSILTGSKKSIYRKQSIYLRDLNGTKLSKFPESKTLNKLMKEFWIWYNQMNHLPFLLKAIGIHFLLATIHPFKDGNGRLSRLLEYYVILSNSSQDDFFFSSELICYWNFGNYSESIRSSLELNSMDPFIEFCLSEQTTLIEELSRQI
jgi:Fic family protein